VERLALLREHSDESKRPRRFTFCSRAFRMLLEFGCFNSRRRIVENFLSPSLFQGMKEVSGRAGVRGEARDRTRLGIEVVANVGSLPPGTEERRGKNSDRVTTIMHMPYSWAPA
jgi:hypothetical protein